MKTHYHCIVIAYDKLDVERNAFLGDIVEVELMGYLDEKDALKRASKLVEAPYYTLRKIWPCFRCKLDNK